MERNRDWKGIAALVLAGLALFVALGGRISFPDQGPSNQIVFVGPGESGSTSGAQSVAPQPVPPSGQPQQTLPQLPPVPNVQQAPSGPSGPGPFQGFQGSPGAWRNAFHGFASRGPGRAFFGLMPLMAFGLIVAGLFIYNRNRRRSQPVANWAPQPPQYPGAPPPPAYGPQNQGPIQPPQPPQAPPPPPYPGSQPPGPEQNGDITRPENTQF